MNNSKVMSFVKVTTEDILEFIDLAKDRIIFIKPAFMKNEVETLLKVVNHNGLLCNLFMESGDKAIRYGFGETAALKLLNENIGKLNIQIADRIRIGVLVVDDKALVYMPNISFIEEESVELKFPNGFLFNETFTKEIVNEFTLKEDNSEIIKRIENGIVKRVDNVLILPGGFTTRYNHSDVKNDLENSLEKLDSNPAVDPANLTKISFYRNNYKIFKMQINGVRIENKRINLKPFYSMLPEVNEKLKSSWNIFSLDDIESLQDTKIFERELNKILDEYKNYIFNAGRFGFIIDVKKKETFKAAVTKLTEDFKEYLAGNSDSEVQNRFAINNDNKNDHIIVKKDLKTVLDESREQLEEHLLKLCPDSDEFLNRVFGEYRHLKRNYELDGDTDIIFKEYIDLFVMNKLRFIDVEDIISKIDVKIDYYDISDEMIFNNEDFKILIDKYKLDLRQTSEGYQGAKPCSSR